MISTRVFRCRPESVRDARHFVRESLSDQAAETVEAAELMTSELVTNSIRHAGADFLEVTISLDGEIRVVVSDSGGGRPVLRSPTASEPSGRGLRIV
jgi:signal transduction histidine kinase